MGSNRPRSRGIPLLFAHSVRLSSDALVYCHCDRSARKAAQRRCPSDEHVRRRAPDRVEAKMERAVGLPKLTLATVFEVVAAGKIYQCGRYSFQRWIVEECASWKAGIPILPTASLE
jgi:hypothetical protein